MLYFFTLTVLEFYLFYYLCSSSHYLYIIGKRTSSYFILYSNNQLCAQYFPHRKNIDSNFMTQTKIGHFHSRKAQATSYFKPGCPPFPCAWWPCHHLFFLASDQNRAVRSLEVKTMAEVHARAKRHAFLKTMPLPGT